MNDIEALERALTYPWEKWTIFLHPAQRQWVERDCSGPVRVSGSAGMGKTIIRCWSKVWQQAVRWLPGVAPGDFAAVERQFEL